MSVLSNLLSFERPLGPVLVQLLYYIAIAFVLWTTFWMIWGAIGQLTGDWDDALSRILWAPVLAALKIMGLRVGAELALALLRMDKSLHEQVTGRAGPRPDQAR